MGSSLKTTEEADDNSTCEAYELMRTEENANTCRPRLGSELIEKRRYSFAASYEKKFRDSITSSEVYSDMQNPAESNDFLRLRGL